MNTFYYLNYDQNWEFAFSLGLFECQTPCISFSATPSPLIKAGSHGELFFPFNEDYLRNFFNMELFLNNIVFGKIRGGMLPHNNEKALHCVE